MWPERQVACAERVAGTAAVLVLVGSALHRLELLGHSPHLR